MESKQFISINLDYIENNLSLTIDAKVARTLFFTSDALDNGEAEYQLVEGFSYDYELNKNNFSLAQNQIVQPHSRKKHVGLISPNTYVGTLTLSILKDGEAVGYTTLEVQSVKANYRNDYRDMLKFITEKSTDLLMQANSPISHNFDTDFNKDSETLYQKFSFVRSIVTTNEFAESIHRIVSSPVTGWSEELNHRNITNIKNFKRSNIKELTSNGNRIPIPHNHYLQKYNLKSLPNKITAFKKTDIVDTPDNRFIKFALESFLAFASSINQKAKRNSKLWEESNLMEQELESFLHHPFFKNISNPSTLKLNSTVLQRKEGYREVLRIWLMFDLAAKLVWIGGEDVYKSGKKDIATLYEYWLFFKLLNLFESLFKIKPKDISELIKETPDGLNLQLKQGKHTALEGIVTSGNRKINVRFNYNRTFIGGKSYPNAGSWTTTMRPDYTLSFWSHGITEQEAENQELIVHIHFDAKYKVANIGSLLEGNLDSNTRKSQGNKQIYKNTDLLKMHAYKDAIRRTSGAYILYPGEVSLNKKGFHEVIPGLGAFAIRPSQVNDGMNELKNFIIEILQHFENRASQQERIANKIFNIYKNPPLKHNSIYDFLPENYNENRNLIPDEVYILINHFTSKAHIEWCMKQGLYNFRINDSEGSLILDEKTAVAKYLFLINQAQEIIIYKISNNPIKIYNKDKLSAMGYPSSNTQEQLVIEIETTLVKKINTSSNLKKLKTPCTISLLSFAQMIE